MCGSRCSLSHVSYRLASVSRIDQMIGLFCQRALQKRRYSAKETCNLIDPTSRSRPIPQYTHYIPKIIHTCVASNVACPVSYLKTHTTFKDKHLTHVWYQDASYVTDMPQILKNEPCALSTRWLRSVGSIKL